MFKIENSTRDNPTEIICECGSNDLQVVLHHDFLEILCRECKNTSAIRTTQNKGKLWNCCCPSANPPIGVLD